MKAKSLNKYLHATALILASLFILLSLNKSLFPHTHVDETGRLVTHSHPYNKADNSSPVKDHSHSGKVLSFFLLLDEGTTIIQFFFTCIFFVTVCLLLSTFNAPLLRNFALSYRNPRAPPVPAF